MAEFGNKTKSQLIIELKRLQKKMEINGLNKTLKELKISEEKYRLLYESSKDAILIMEVTEKHGAKVLDCNNRTLKLFNLTSRDQMIGKTPAIFSPSTQQDDGEASDIKVRELGKSAMGGRPQQFEWEHIHSDGSPFWVEVNINRILLEDKYFLQATVRDITKRKQAVEALKERESLLAETQEMANIGSWIWDILLNKTVWSPNLYKIFGVTSNSFNPNAYESFLNRIHQDDRQLVIDAMEISMKTGKPFDIEYRIVRPDDMVRIIHAKGIVHFDKNGKPYQMKGSSQDISEQKKLEEQLHQSEKMQAIGQLAGGVAHDFNNQLTGILNFAELTKEAVKENSSITLYINNIISGTLRSAELTQQLLAFARKGKYVVTAVDINKTISEVVDMLTHSVDKKIKLMQHSNANPSTVSGDKSQLQNAILNIALNARDAMPKGGELIFTTDIVTLRERSIKLKAHDIKSGKYLKIKIVDNGSGMDSETKKHIFEPFFTTKEQGKGIGMGMASVYGTVKNHNGMIEVESKLDQGTSVTIFLPVVSAEKKNIEKSITKPAKVEGQILIVDDEEMIATSLRIMLINQGYQATNCRNGKEALNIFEKSWEKIDLVLLDMIMPEMNGEETFIAMNKINPNVKVLLLSGFSITEEAKGLIKKGALGFLQKPVRRKDLLNKIADVFSKE